MQVLAFHPMELERHSFAAMPAHMQTELLLLAMERGSTVSELKTALRLSEFDIRKIAWTRHLHTLHSVGVSSFEDADAERREEKRRDRVEVGDFVLSRSQFAVLKWIANRKHGQVSVVRTEMAAAVKITIKALDGALVALMDHGLITRHRFATKNRPATWGVTDQGKEIVFTLQNGGAA